MDLSTDGLAVDTLGGVLETDGVWLAYDFGLQLFMSRGSMFTVSGSVSRRCCGF